MDKLYQVKFDPQAAKVFAALDGSTKLRIRNYINKNLHEKPSPQALGKELEGSHKGLIRYRVGKYRLVCQIRESELIILVLKIGHRQGVY
ncbi:MAG: type II toxin-antitoxin system RelE/ParE family toxin [Coriobacteriia bacterium]|nr:type II toxin-antitoxin system RelE/ParE family toxin [Coriobacteriia bacterium]